MANRYERSKKRSFFKTFFPVFILLLIVSTIGVFAIDKFGFFGLFGGDIMKDVTPIAGGDSEFAQRYADSKRINVLVLGHNNGLTDTIMMCSFDTENKRVDIVSVPRDTYYERPEYDDPAFHKINSVYETEGEIGAATAVSNVLGGVPIHYYEILEDKDVAAIVDSMGGVEFDVPMDMKYTDKKQDLYIDLKQGVQVLDGDHAVQYLRYRKGYATGDIGRVEAQQGFMKEAFKQSIGIGFPKVAKTVFEEVESNLNAKMAVRIGSEAIGMEASDIETYTAPGESGMENGASYFFVNRAETDELMNVIYSYVRPEETK